MVLNYILVGCPWKFALQHNLPARKKIIGTSDILHHEDLKSFRPTDPFLYRMNTNMKIATRENSTSNTENEWQSRAGNHHIHGQNNHEQHRKWPLNVTQTTAKIRLIRSVKIWNPPQCNLGILDFRTNKNLQPLCNTNNSKLNETKDQFRIRSTKRSHREPVMALRLHTSQIFKGRAYELKYRAYGVCSHKQQPNLL